MSFTMFQPAPDLADKVIADISDPATSLRHVAALHSTTLEALCLWIGSEAVQSRLIAQAKTAAFITRFHAANHADAALAGIVTALRESTTLLAAAPPIPQQTDSTPAHASLPVPQGTGKEKRGEQPTAPNNASPQLGTHPLEFRRRLVESLRKNSNLIFRLTRFEFLAELPERARRPRAASQTHPDSPLESPPPVASTHNHSTHAQSSPLPANAPHRVPHAAPVPSAPAAPIRVPQPAELLAVPSAIGFPEPPITSQRQPAQRPRAPASLLAAAGRSP
ncbi:hypothetical protein PHYC_02355 [Phycisphaerales bacterium]|nr:hypothetical protein PHYC_02355 [Phycisphaerales bacterium]